VTATGFTLYSPAGKDLASVSSFSAVRGSAATDNDSTAAVWTAAAASFHGWHAGMVRPTSPTAQLQSTVLPGLDHAVDEMRMVDTMAALPPGSALIYWGSTDGGATWTETPPLQPMAVPTGSLLVYGAVLSTADPAQMPVLDTTDL